jgi:hypothetical protein
MQSGVQSWLQQLLCDSVERTARCLHVGASKRVIDAFTHASIAFHAPLCKSRGRHAQDSQEQSGRVPDGGRACSTAAPARQPRRAQSRSGRPATSAARKPAANRSPAPGGRMARASLDASGCEGVCM